LLCAEKINRIPVVDVELLRLFLGNWDVLLASGFWLSPEFAHDPDPVCHQERLSQQTPQRSDRVEPGVLSASAHFDDDDLARLLFEPGQR
jgi:hypothetical protein